MHAPRTSHLGVVHRILRYLKMALGHDILYGAHGHAQAKACTDADKAESMTDCKFTTGYLM